MQAAGLLVVNVAAALPRQFHSSVTLDFIAGAGSRKEEALTFWFSWPGHIGHR